MIDTNSIRKGGPVRRQSLRLGWSADAQQLQLYTMQIGVVLEFFFNWIVWYVVDRTATSRHYLLNEVSVDLFLQYAIIGL